MEVDSAPYLAEYAKSNRASCKSCTSLIAKESLRIALMVQSRHFDGKQPNWYHYSCFFGRFRPVSVDEIGHFHNLRWEDQEKIRAQVERKGSTTGGKKGKGPKLLSKSLQDFVIQYALSGKSTCKRCEEKIAKVATKLMEAHICKAVTQAWGNKVGTDDEVEEDQPAVYTTTNKKIRKLFACYSLE